MKRFFINNLLLLTTIFLILCISSCDISTHELVSDGLVYICSSGDNLSIDDCLSKLHHTSYYPDNIWSIDIKQEYKIKRITISIPGNGLLGDNMYNDFNSNADPSPAYCYVINYNDINNISCEAKIYFVFTAIPVEVLEKYDKKINMDSNIYQNTYLYRDITSGENVLNDYEYETEDEEFFMNYHYNQTVYGYYNNEVKDGDIIKNILLRNTDDYFSFFLYIGPNEFDTSILEYDIIKKISLSL